jgi:hypothetical protein
MMAMADIASQAKSRDATASSVLCTSEPKPSPSAVTCLSIGKRVPASAPAPSGMASILGNAAWSRSMSRPRASDTALR